MGRWYRRRRLSEAYGFRNAVILMYALGIVLVVGLALTAVYNGARYRPWMPPLVGEGPPSIRQAALVYVRGAAIGLVGGFWAGALVTGPAIRLIMRLLAVTGGDDAQGKLTEAEEIVGRIDFDGTFGLYVFGGLLPGLVSGFVYVLVRRWLPAGRWGGVLYGLLHLLLATRLDPLRPDNVDFDLVGPSWLALLTFGLASVVHGMAVVALANRYSRMLPLTDEGRVARARQLAPLVLPVMFLVPAAFLAVPVVLGLFIAVAVLQVDGRERIASHRAFLLYPRVFAVLVTAALLPSTILDLRNVLFRS